MLASITGTDLDRLGDEIAELSAHLDAATARLLTLIREFDAQGGWAQQGCRSCAEWLSWRAGLDLGAARERVRVARALGELPQLAAALARGELSYSKVRALTRVATPETEARLLAVGQAGTTAHVERIVRAWRRLDRLAEAQEAAARHARRSLQVYPDEDGMVVVRGRVEPEVGAMLMRALDAAREVLYQRRRADGPEAEPPTHGQQQADALALVAETALAQGLDPGNESERYQVVVHVDAAVLADPEQPGQSALEDGLHVSAETSRRLACDATRVIMHHAGDGHVLDVGRRTRAIPPALRRALQARDRGCRFPGCGVRHAQGHHIGFARPGRRGPSPATPGGAHIHHWANGGRPGSTTWRSSAGAIIGPSTRRAIRSRGTATARFASAGRMGGRFPTCHGRRPSRATRPTHSSRPTGRTAWRSTARPGARAGSASGSTSTGRSRCCTRPPSRPPPSRRRRSLDPEAGRRRQGTMRTVS
jgi:hypothetical protein